MANQLIYPLEVVIFYPRCSMYEIFTYICIIFGANVGTYTSTTEHMCVAMFPCLPGLWDMLKLPDMCHIWGIVIAAILMAWYDYYDYSFIYIIYIYIYLINCIIVTKSITVYVTASEWLWLQYYIRRWNYRFV